MAAICISRIVPESTRKGWKVPYGDLPAVVASANQELADGQLENAWTAYQLAIEQWLRQRWLAVKPTATVTDREVLLNKLRASGTIDAITHQAIALMLKNRPTPVGWIHADMMAAICKAVVSERGRHN